MVTFVRKRFSNNLGREAPFPKVQVHKYELKEYDETYRVPLFVQKLVGLRLLQKDSEYVRLCWNIFYWFEFANLMLVSCLEVIKMVETARGGTFQDAIVLFTMMPCLTYVSLAMAKSYKIVRYRSVYENLFTELRDMWPQETVSEDEHRIINKSMTQLRYVIRVYYYCNNALLAVFLTTPFIVYAQKAMGYNVELILPLFYWFPFDPFQKGVYEVVLVFMTWHGLITIWFMVCGDLLYSIYISHITIQFDLLAVRIRKFVYVPIDMQLIGDFPLGVYSKQHLSDHNGYVEDSSDSDRESGHLKEITEIILRHRRLIRLSGDVESIFSFALLLNFVNSSIILCFCGFCCIVVEKWNHIVYKSFLITALLQTWLLCWFGQRLIESSVGVSSALYNSGWYRVSKRISNSILIMIHRAQKEVHVTTYGFSVISLASYTTIIKTAWSYFTLLLKVYMK